MNPSHHTHHRNHRRLGAVWLAALLFAGAAPFLRAAPAAAPSAAASAPVQVSDAWARWLPSGLPAGGYLTLSNPGATDVILTGASSPDYAMVHLHESYTNDNGASAMRMVSQVRIPAGGKVQFRPGGLHLMLMRAKRKLAPGDTVTVELHFAGGARLDVALPLKQPGHDQP